MRYGILAAGLAATMAATPGIAQMEGMDHTAHAAMADEMADDMAAVEMPTVPVSEPGQGAFAAIAEIVATLEADPETDWSKVDIAALRAHLVDMDVVTTQAMAESAAIDGGMRFTVTGEGAVAASIQRMVTAHAAIMDGVDGWTMTAEETPDGAVLDVQVPPEDLPRLTGLGFFGVLASGMHHQSHHWAMATGANPHG